MYWSGVDYCFYQLFGLSFWRHPFTAEDPLLSKWCSATFLQICSHEETNSSKSWMAWGWVHLKQISLEYHWNHFQNIFFLADEWKSLIANQNPSCFKELDHLKWQTPKLQCTLIINKLLSCIGVDANAVIFVVNFIVIIHGVKGP